MTQTPIPGHSRSYNRGQTRSRRKGDDDAKKTIEEWRVEYNKVRPHRSLKNATPAAFATKFSEQKPAGNPLPQLA